MDLLIKLKKGLASTLSVAVVAMTLVIAPSAYGFKDVATSDWFAPYVDALTTAGVFKSQDNFRPADNMTRAEFVKTLVVAAGISTDGAADAKFSDVKSSDWFAPYVNAAVAAGVVQGSDKSSAFRPNDNVSRAEAVKIALNAFGIDYTKYKDPAASFTDTKGHWAEEMVSAAYNLSIVDGIGGSKTTFGPNDSITRSAVAKIASYATIVAEDPASYVRFDDGASAFSVYDAQEVVSQVSSLISKEVTDSTSTDTTTDTTTSTDTTTTTTTTTTTPVSNGTLEVSLSSKSPAAQTIAKGVVGTTVASYDLTASSDDVVLTGLTVSRTGVGARTDIEAVYLYSNGAKLTGSRTISSDTNTAQFSSLNVKVEAGKTVTLDVVVDISYSAGSGNQHAFAITSASAVTANAQKVAGDFPLTSKTFSTGGSTVGYVQVQSTGSVSNPAVGDKQAEIAKFQLTAGSDNIQLKQITLNNTGTAGSDKVANLTLFQGSTDLKATVTRNNDRFTFVLPTPFKISNGTNKTFTVKGDVIGGLNNQTVIFNVEEKGDVQAMDEVFNSNAITFDSDDTTSSQSFTNVALQTVTLKGGDATVTFTGPAARNVSKGAKAVQLVAGTITFAASVTVKNSYVYLSSTEPNGATSGLCDNSSNANFTNVKLVNSETNAVIAGPLDYTCSSDTIGGSADTSVQLTFTDDWNADAGKSIPFAVIADIRNASGNTTNDLTATFGHNGNNNIWASTDLKKTENSEYLTSIVPSTPIAGNKQSVLASSLSISVASTPTSQTLVKGAKARDLLGLNLQAGTNSDVKVTQVKLYGDAGTASSDIDATFGETGGTDVRAANVVQTVYLYDGSTLLSTKSFDTSNDSVTFDNLSLKVTAGATKTLTVKGDINSSLSSATYFAMDLYSGYTQSDSSLQTNVTSEDVDGNDIAEVGGTKFKNITASATATSLMTLSPTGGAINVATDADTPTAAVVLMSTAKKEVYRAKLTASTENFRVERLSFVLDNNTNTSGDNDNNVSKVYMEYPTSLTDSTAVNTVEGTLSGGVVLFDITSTPMMLKKDADAKVKLYVDINDSTSATSQEFIKFYVNLADFKAYGDGSQVQQTGANVRLNTGSNTTYAGYIGSTAAATAYGFGSSGLVNGAVTSTTATTITVDGDTNYKVGDLVLIDSEQLIVTANLAAAGDLSVLRGANGTTAAAHADNSVVYKLGQVSAAVATEDNGQASTATALYADVTSALARGDVLIVGGTTTAFQTAVVTSDLAAANDQTVSTVTRSASVGTKITGVVSSAPADASTIRRLSSYRPVVGSNFSVAKATAVVALASSSASGSRTTATQDNVLTITVTNGGSFASTLKSLTLSATGSLVQYTAGWTPTVKIYDSSSFNDSNLVFSGNMSAVTADNAIPSTTIASTSFSKTVEIAANSSKTLYVVLNTSGQSTSGEGYNTTTSDDLLTLNVTNYAWNDGVNDFTASDTGYGLTLPVSGNTLRY